MRGPVRWIVLAVVALLTFGCDENNKLYTSDKYVPGYKPSGDMPAKALAYAREHNISTTRER
jgi:hypothetical protein